MGKTEGICGKAKLLVYLSTSASGMDMAGCIGVE